MLPSSWKRETCQAKMHGGMLDSVFSPAPQKPLDNQAEKAERREEAKGV
jgi:hypothetical protein